MFLQLMMLLSAYPVHGLAHVLPGVKPLMYDLPRRARHMLKRGFAMGLPHAHAHSLDPLQLVRRELEKNIYLLINIIYCSLLQVY